jgi:hypothetical protein
VSLLARLFLIFLPFERFDATRPRVLDSKFIESDELNHALTSFEIASLLTGKPIATGKLPLSQHAFEKNLTARALARNEARGKHCRDLVGAINNNGGRP